MRGESIYILFKRLFCVSLILTLVIASGAFAPSASAAPVLGTGTGLRGEYFDNNNFTNLKLTRTDATIDFNWGTGSPHSSINKDTFSVVWTGYIEPLYSETYRFYTNSDDGVRVWINGRNILNYLGGSTSYERSGSYSLVANKKYTIRVEYYENSGSSNIYLKWSSPSQSKQIIPKSQLYPAGNLANPPPPPAISPFAVTTNVVKIDKTFNFTESIIEKVETIDYKVYGDEFLVDYPKDIALVVDVSGSMDGNLAGNYTTDENQKRISILKKAAKIFVSKFSGRNVRICIVPFSYYADPSLPMVYMKDANSVSVLEKQIEDLMLDDCTNIGDGMRVAYHRLKCIGSTVGGTKIGKYIITLTDGNPNKWIENPNSPGNYYTGNVFDMIDRVMPSSHRVYNSNIGNYIYFDTPYGNYDNNRGLTYCTNQVGTLIRNDIDFGSFIIGFSSETDDANLERMGVYSGARPVASNGGKHYYKALNENDLIKTYNDIGDIINSEFPFSFAMFSDTLPEGVDVVDVSQELKDIGYSINDVTVSGVTRKQITAPLNLVLERARPGATTYPENQLYRLRPMEFSIEIKFIKPPGNRIFYGKDTFIDFLNPLNNQPGRAEVEINKTIKAYQVDLFDQAIFIGAGQKDVDAVVTPANVAFNPIWSITDSTMTSPNTLINYSSPSLYKLTMEAPEYLPGSGLKNSAGTKELNFTVNVDGKPYTITKKVKVLDAWLEDIIMQKGNIVQIEGNKGVVDNSDLSKISFTNWRTDPIDITKTEIDGILKVYPDGKVEALSNASITLTVYADAVFTDGTITARKTVSAKVNIVDFTLGGTAVFLGSSTDVSANISPEIANQFNATWTVNGGNAGTVVNVAAKPFKPEAPGDVNATISAPATGNSIGFKQLNVVAKDAELNTFNASGQVTVVDANMLNEISVEVWKSADVSANTLKPAGATGIFESAATIDPVDADKVEITNLGNNTFNVRAKKMTGSTAVTVTVNVDYKVGEEVMATKTLTLKVKTFNIIDIN